MLTSAAHFLLQIVIAIKINFQRTPVIMYYVVYNLNSIEANKHFVENYAAIFHDIQS